MDAQRAFHDLATRFAPELHLHPDERYLPMRPEDFLGKARLALVRRRGRGLGRVAVYDPERRLWDQDAADWSHFGVRAELLQVWDALHGPPEGEAWTRRPHDEPGPPDGNLYALEHQTDAPTGSFDPASPPPCYYFVEERENATWISYWFFYGNSKFLAHWAHQADWEHLRIRVQDGRVDEVLFGVHHMLYRVRRHLLTMNGDTLTAFSAKGRHATWWKTGSHVPLAWFKKTTSAEEVLSREDRALIQDETAEGGPVWRTGRSLEPLDEQPWRLYAGAWGRAGDSNDGTGPLGPWYKRFLRPDREIVEED